MQQIKLINKEAVQRTRGMWRKIFMRALAILYTIAVLVMLLMEGWKAGNLFIYILVPGIIWTQALRKPVQECVMVEVEEILEELPEGLGIRIAQIDRGDMNGSHSERILCPRDRVKALTACPEEYRLEVLGRPIFYFLKREQTLTLDTATDYDEDYRLLFWCTADTYPAVLSLLQTCLQREAVNAAEQF